MVPISLTKNIVVWSRALFRDAWDKIKGMSKEQAMKEYVEKLIEVWGTQLFPSVFVPEEPRLMYISLCTAAEAGWGCRFPSPHRWDWESVNRILHRCSFSQLSTSGFPLTQNQSSILIHVKSKHSTCIMVDTQRTLRNCTYALFYDREGENCFHQMLTRLVDRRTRPHVKWVIVAPCDAPVYPKIGYGSTNLKISPGSEGRLISVPSDLPSNILGNYLLGSENRLNNIVQGHLFLWVGIYVSLENLFSTELKFLGNTRKKAYFSKCKQNPSSNFCSLARGFENDTNFNWKSTTK